MDETDIQICRMLLMDSRQPYRSISKALGISNQAVHRRVQLLEQAGVIRRYTVSLSDRFMNAVMIGIKGSSELRCLDELVKALERDDRTMLLLFCDLDKVFITALLRDISELDDYLRFLTREVKIAEPNLAFGSTLRFGEDGVRQQMKKRVELKPLDYRIIRALSNDSRKPIGDLAQLLGISAKTVKRRLERMMEESVLEFGIDIFPGASPSAFVYFWVQVRPGVDMNVYMNRFVEKFDRHILLSHAMSSVPGLFASLIWAPNQKIVNNLEVEVSKDPSVVWSRTNSIQDVHHFRTWRDRLIEANAEIRDNIPHRPPHEARS